MKKSLLAVGVALALTSGIAQSATLVAGETYRIEILADGNSCFTFGNCQTAVPGAVSYIIDNDNDAAAALAYTPNPGFGSANAGDSLAGWIDISTTSDGNGGVNFTVDSYNMDTYNGTAGGQFATAGTDGAGNSTIGSMSGSIRAGGNIEFDPTGRYGVAQYFAATTSLGVQPWNTGSTFSSNNQYGAVGGLFGQALASDGSATIVSNSAVGPAWGFFLGTPYTEVFSLNIVGTSAGAAIVNAVPVPAAVWLFGSGLLGLVGIARRKKSA